MFKISKQEDSKSKNFTILKSEELSRLIGGMNGKVKWGNDVLLIDGVEPETGNENPDGMNNGTVKF